MSLLGISSNTLDLNVDTKRQSLDSNKRTSRSVSGKELLVNLVDLSKVVDISNKHIDLDDALPSGTGSSDYSLDVGENLASLNLNVLMSLDKLSLGGERNLTRKVEESIGLDCLAVRADGRRSVFSEDLLKTKHC